LFASAVNTSGVIRAVNLDKSGGTISLVGAGSPVVASGTLDASGKTGADIVGTAQITGDSVSLGTSTVHGIFGATSVTGDITETGAVTADAGAVFSSAGNINLGTQANMLPTPTFTFTGTTGNLGLREVTAIAMPAITVPGSITLISDTGTITQTGPITATAGSFTTSTANQAITLGDAGNIFTGAVSLNTTGTGTATIESAALNLGTSNVSGTLTATSATGDITESGVLTAATGSSFISAGNINLGTQANVLPAPNFIFTGATGNLGLREVAAIAMPAFTVPGSITLISDTGSITQTGPISATAGSFTTSTANQAITLSDAGNTFTGAVSLNTTGTGTATIEAAE